MPRSACHGASLIAARKYLLEQFSLAVADHCFSAALLRRVANLKLDNALPCCVAVELEFDRIAHLPERSAFDLYVACDSATQRVSSIGARRGGSLSHNRRSSRKTSNIDGIVVGLKMLLSTNVVDSFIDLSCVSKDNDYTLGEALEPFASRGKLACTAPQRAHGGTLPNPTRKKDPTRS